MKTITVNYRNRKQSFVYDIDDNIDVYVKFKNSKDLCIGTSNEEPFVMAWSDYGLDDWTNDSDGAPKPITYSDHIAEALQRFFENKR